MIKFKYVFSIIGGNGFKEKYQGKIKGDYPFYKVSDINSNCKYVDEAQNWVNKEIVDQEKYSIITKRSIIMPKIGEALKKNHRKINLKECIIDNNCQALIKKDNSSIEYLYYLSSIIDMVWFDNGGTIPSINNSKLSNSFLPIPTLEEQKEIANFLDEKITEIDKVIEKTKETIEDYKKYKQSIITEAVTKGSNRKNKKDKTKYLSKTKMKYLADINPRSEKEINEYDEVTYTPMEYIKNGYYIQNTGLWKNNTSSYNTYLENDIVMAKVTPCFENGNIAIMNNLVKGIGYGSSELIIFRCKNNIENKYLFYLLQSEVFKKLCVSAMTGTGGLKRVSIEFIKNYVCYIPEKAEQKNIVEYLDLKCKEIEKIIKNKEDLITELENYKKSLIYEYVTGKKEINRDVNYSAEDISNWILNKNLENRKNGKETVGITNLKLQKLLYYASGIYFLYKKCNLIKEDFVAWKHGPVIKQIYYKYNSNGAKEIQHNKKSKNEIDNETQKILEQMYSKYSQYTAEELRNMTHQERPWKKTNRNKIIEKDLIKDYFENEYKWEQ